VRDHTLEFLADAKQQTKPFFIYAAFNAPHDPRQAPKKMWIVTPLSRMAMPSFLPDVKDAIGCATTRGMKTSPHATHPTGSEDAPPRILCADRRIDTQIGLILGRLDASGQADNTDTWIFFTADHGLAVGNHG